MNPTRMLRAGEDNLYYLAMTTWQLGEADKGGELVAQHLKEFPQFQVCSHA